MARRASDYRPEIDGLRALAVGSVIAFHIDERGLPGGFLGVDVFFVISGFLITRGIWAGCQSGTFSFRRFYYRRLRRIAPALLCTVAVTLALSSQFIPELYLPELASTAIGATLSFVNFVFWSRSGYFEAEAISRPLLHTWSLSVEEQFYLVWPAILWWLRGRGSNRLSWAVAFLALGSLLCCELVMTRDPALAFYASPTRFFEFAIGGWLAFVPTDFGAFRRLRGEGLAALGLVLVLVSLWTSPGHFPGVGALPACLGTALLLRGCETGEWARSALSIPPLRYAGQISYSLYLVHWPILSLAWWSGIELGEEASPAWRTPVVVLAMLLSSMLLHHAIEVPLRYPERDDRPRRFVWATLGATLALCALATLHVMAETDQRHVRIHRSVDPTSTVDDPFGDVDLLLIGDSHAERLQSFVHGLVSDLQLSAIVSSRKGCTPAFGTHQPGGQMERRCDAAVGGWERIVPEARARFVVIAARWAMRTEPPAYGPFQLDSRYGLTRGPDEEPSVENGRHALAEALSATVDRLVASGKLVVLVGQAPHQGYRVDFCVDRLRMRGVSDAEIIERCAVIDRDTALARLDFSNRLLVHLAELHPDRVYAFLPSEFLCDVNPCRFYDSRLGRLYSDSNHLSSAGNRHLLERSDALLEWMRRGLDDELQMATGAARGDPSDS